MLRAGARPTVGAYGPVRLHLPSVRIFAYFPSVESMKKMLRAGAMPTVGAYGLVRLHFRRLDFLDTFLSSFH